ncbi:hypothetical protein ABEB36_006536 [Hypothenemus hampei]|uniref:Uncharacterized protein n=1 Tax=Hypothenemus hampei TaxID=57062 RepID=A0ABD1EQV4_HYPHA
MWYRDKVYPEILSHLKERPEYKEIPEAFDRLEKAIDYTVPHGKGLRSLWTMKSYKFLANLCDLTRENCKLSAVLTWITEMLFSVILILDDIMNNSDLRCGKIACSV